MKLKMTVLRYVVPRSMVQSDRRFRDAYCCNPVCKLSTPNNLTRKSREGSLLYCKTGAQPEALVDEDPLLVVLTVLR